MKQISKSFNTAIGTLVLFAVVIALASMFTFLQVTKANPTGFALGARTAITTTTFAVLAAGNATTTLTYDAYGISGTNENGSGSTAAADSASLLVQFTASSTASKLKIAYEYSQDGVDWYQDALTSTFATTTTGVLNTNVPNSFSWTFASTSVGAAGILANNNLATEIFPVYTPTRFVRAVITASGANAMVWAQIVPKKEI